MKKYILFLSALLLSACMSDENKETIHKLELEIKSLKEENEYQKKEIKNTLKKELVESLHKCQNSVNNVFLYSYDSTAFKIALLDFFNISNVSNGKDPFFMLSSLLLWLDLSNEEDVSRYDFSYTSEFNRIFRYVDRKETNIKKLFNNNKKFIFDAVDSYRYFNSKASLFTNSLLKTYGNIVNSPDYTSWMSEFQKRKINDKDERSELVIIFEQRFGVINDLPILNNLDSDHKTRMKYWLYSFWIRRFAEGNINAVHDIILDIQHHYGEKNHNE